MINNFFVKKENLNSFFKFKIKKRKAILHFALHSLDKNWKFLLLNEEKMKKR
jgi:hypothetical protein